MFYFICVEAITLLFNKHFAYKIDTLSRLPLLLALINLTSTVRTEQQYQDRQHLVCVKWLEGLIKASPYSPKYDALLPLKKRADRVPGAFLLASTHICWLTPHHRAALKPSEEDETLTPSVFNGRWLGHERANVGGSGLTFLQEHHKTAPTQH